MPETDTSLTASELHEVAREALLITGAPVYPCAEADADNEVLLYFDAEAEEPAIWALGPESDAEAELLPVPVAVASCLIQAHLARWLVERGWQVQLRVVGERREWRLVDCLPASRGGGDRIEEEYPAGEDPLRVICGSVGVAARAR